jgi:hypothetical protein
VSGIALINFLYCVYDSDMAVRDGKGKPKASSKSTLKDKVSEKLREKLPINESLPQEIRLFFQPKDKKDYY